MASDLIRDMQEDRAAVAKYERLQGRLDGLVVGFGVGMVLTAIAAAVIL